MTSCGSGDDVCHDYHRFEAELDFLVKDLTIEAEIDIDIIKDIEHEISEVLIEDIFSVNIATVCLQLAPAPPPTPSTSPTSSPTLSPPVRHLPAPFLPPAIPTRCVAKPWECLDDDFDIDTDDVGAF